MAVKGKYRVLRMDEFRDWLGEPTHSLRLTQAQDIVKLRLKTLIMEEQHSYYTLEFADFGQYIWFKERANHVSDSFGCHTKYC